MLSAPNEESEVQRRGALQRGVQEGSMPSPQLSCRSWGCQKVNLEAREMPSVGPGLAGTHSRTALF